MYTYGWWRDFPHPFRPALWPNQPPIQWVPSISRRKGAGAWRRPPTPSSAEVKERVELTPIRNFVACFRLNLSFIFNFTCMDEWMDGCVCLCMRASIPICIKACVNVCACVICVWVCMCEYMNVCVYTIHIYAFRLYSGAVFHGSGTFILRSTDK